LNFQEKIIRYLRALKIFKDWIKRIGSVRFVIISILGLERFAIGVKLWRKKSIN
jgi:hypothetical protein